MKKKSIKNLKNQNLYNNLMSFAICVATLVICYGAIRNGHEIFATSIVVLMVMADFSVLIIKRKIKRKFYGIDLLPFICVIFIEVILQYLFYRNQHYEIKNSIWTVIVLSVMVFSIAVIISDGFGEKIWEMISLVSIVSSCCILMQSVLMIFGIRLDSISVLKEWVFNAWEFQNGAFIRPSGPFSEPSHFAEIALLGFYYNLFITKKINKVIIIGCAIVCSTSGLGYLGLALLSAFYVLGMKETIASKAKRIIISVSIPIIFLGLLVWVTRTESVAVSRLLAGGTSSVRVFRSFELYSIIDFFGKLFGIGLQNQELYLNWNSIILMNDTYETISSHREFAQTFGYLLCTTGLIGELCFWVPLIKNAKQFNISGRVFLILFLAVCIIACILTRATFLLYLLCFFALLEMKKNNEKYRFI